MRAFVAIPLNPEVRSNVEAFYQTLKGAKGVKAVPAENLHITLDFLGEIDPEEKALLVPGLAAAAAQIKPFSLEIKGTGAFPKVSAPKTLWLGMEGQKELFALAAAVKTVTKSTDRKKFSPHLTVARVKYEDQSQNHFFTEFFKYGDFSFGTLEITSFFLMKSDLSGKVPVYSVIEEFIIKDGVI